MSKDKMDLRQWLSVHDNQDDMRSLFHRMDAKMKYIHGKGYYIMDFEPSKIDVDDSDVYFQFLGSMTNDNYASLMNHNIYTMSFLQIASYSNCLNYLRTSFLSENFEEFVPFLPKEDVAYYKSVILDKKYNYLTDYRRVFEQVKLKEQNTGSEGFSNTNQRTYTKATAAGKLYSENNDYLNNAAFSNVVELTVIIVATTLIILLSLIISLIR